MDIDTFSKYSSSILLSLNHIPFSSQASLQSHETERVVDNSNSCSGKDEHSSRSTIESRASPDRVGDPGNRVQENLSMERALSSEFR